MLIRKEQMNHLSLIVLLLFSTICWAADYQKGLDLGTTSIGWCLVSLSSEAEPKAIMRAGVRIFSDGRNPKDGTSLAEKNFYIY